MRSKVIMSERGFRDIVETLVDANIGLCMVWFGTGKSFQDVFDFLTVCWSRDEVEGAFMKINNNKGGYGKV